MKINFEIDTERDGEELAQRMLRCDSAWSALWDIKQEVRKIWKYEDLEGVDPRDLIDRVYTLICDFYGDSGIEEIYT